MTPPILSTTRWSPTAEQLMFLEEMYRGGIKTPNASQIHHITTHLSSYGKIEGKNVFYWFQNHKARDRQKLRRKLLMQHSQFNNIHKNHYNNFNSSNSHYLQHSPTLHLHQLPHYSLSPSFLNQDTSKEWKVNLQERCGSDKHGNKAYYHDWMMMTNMMMDVSPTLPSFNHEPLKTLQLFPITSSTTLKDDLPLN